MSLLYADLPDRPEPPAERSRVELVLGAVAAIGATVVGARVIGDLVQSAGATRPRPNGFASSESAAAPLGVERSVESTGTILRLDDVPVVEYAPVSDDDNARSAVDTVPAPAPLPGTGTPPKTVPATPAPVPAPAPAAVPPTTTSVPPTTVPTTTVPSTTPPTTVPSTVAPTTTSPTTTAPPADVEPSAGVQTLALTAGFTLTSQMATTIDAVGYEGWVEMQLDPLTTPDPVVDTVVVDFDLLDTDPTTLHAAGLGPVALSQTRWAGFARALVGERQVQETLVDLWREFFAVHAPAADLVGLEQVIRRHALDGYAILLDAVIGSSAVRAAFVLSASPSADELLDSNLARTVLERFAFGDPDAFDELAVDAAAVALSNDRASFLANLVSDPRVAAFVAGILTSRVLGDAAPADAHAAARSAFELSGGSVRAVVRQLLLDGLGHADPSRVKSGRGWLTASLQALGADVRIGGPWNADDSTSLPGALRLLGAEPGIGAFRSDEGWLESSMVSSRWQVARALTGGTFLDATASAREVPAEGSAAEFVEQVAESCGVSITPVETSAILHYLSLEDDEPAPTLDAASVADLRGLVLSFPSFQRRDGGAS